MPLKKQDRRHAGVKPQLQTVQDVEVKQCGNPTPTSPPATEEDRANFQKLLLQMNGVNISGKSNISKVKDSDTAKNVGVINSPPLRQHVHENKDPNALLNHGAPPKSDNHSDSMYPTPNDAKCLGEKKKRLRNKKPQKIVPGSPCPSTEILQAETRLMNSNIESLKGKDTKKQSQNCDLPTGDSPFTRTTLPSNDVPKKNEKQGTNFERSSVTQPFGSHKHEPFKSKRQFNQLPSSERGMGERPLKPHESSPIHNRSEIKFRRDLDIRKGPDILSARNSSPMQGSIPQPSNCETNQPLLVYDFDPLTLLTACVNRILPKEMDPSSFHCLPCDKVFVDLKRHFEKHRDSHILKWKMEMRRHTLGLLPDPTPQHISLLDDLVQSVTKQYGMSDKNYELASDAWQRLQALASSNFPGCTVRWFGSHFSKTALLENELLNMDLYVPNKEDAASTFLKFISVIEKDSTFGNVDRVIATNFAHANMVDNNSSYAIQLSLNNTGAYQTAKLIREYVALDPRVRPLCIVFRAWGKLCGLDRGEDGSWQGHAFPLMVIHFLQQKGVLPVLHDLIETPERSPDVYLSGADLSGRWICQNNESLGSLFLNMLKYYSIEHDVEKHIVCVTQLKPFLRTDTKWTAKRIAVIDPFQPKHNISRFITANMYDYVHYCLLTTVCALGIPRTAAGPLYGYIVPALDMNMFQRCPEILNQYCEVSDIIFELVLRGDESFNFSLLKENNEERIPQLFASLRSSQVFELLSEKLKIFPSPPLSHTGPTKSPPNAYSMWCITPTQATTIMKYLRKDLLKYSFTKSIFTENELPPVSCSSCHKHGHIKADCPDEVIPKMKPLPKPPTEHIRILDQLCQHVFDNWSSGPEEHQYRREVREDLLLWLQKYYPDIDLHLFGSSCNGFGGKTSDIDMCLTYKDNDTGAGLNFPSLVEEITQKLKGHKMVYRLLPITTAKVPIVKFEYGRNHIQVDMSLYNLLGIKNTELLHTYSTIDPRVRPLVYMMKRLAKTTGIGDASRGSLSSYAYSLMTLYFLQQIHPPVIPVLQELSDPGSKPGIELIDSANVYFFKNMEKLDEVWSYRNKNESTLGELWLQLLEFYASDTFHGAQRVVCIRKKEPLYKFDKLWTSTNICIEDPFDLSHNLGSGLTKRMNIFIVKTFQKAYKHFSSVPKPELMKGNVEAYFFHESALSAGKPPSDRGCHFCHCIGHVQYDCPKRNLNRNVGGKRGNDTMPINRINTGSKRISSPRPNFNFDNFSRRENQRLPNHTLSRPNNVLPHHISLNQMPVNHVASNVIPQKQLFANQAPMNQIPSNQMHPSPMLTNQLTANPIPSNHMTSNQIPASQMHVHPQMNHQPLSPQTHPLMVPVRPPPGFPLVAPGPPGRPMVRIMGPPLMPGIPLQAPPPQPPNVWR